MYDTFNVIQAPINSNRGIKTGNNITVATKPNNDLYLNSFSSPIAAK